MATVSGRKRVLQPLRVEIIDMAIPPPAPLRAVVTADIVESTKRLSQAQREAFADALRGAYGRLQNQLAQELPYPIAVFGGDSWQAYVHDPAAALRVALYLRAWARATFDVDTRFALAIDTVDFLSEHNVAESDGAAFRISGRMAEDLSGEQRLLISVMIGHDDQFRSLEEVTDELLMTAGDAVARLADRIARGWTAAQAEAIMWRLFDPEITHEEIAERWMPAPVTHQSISKHLRRGGWSDLHGALRHYKSTAEAAAKFAGWLQATSPESPR